MMSWLSSIKLRFPKSTDQNIKLSSWNAYIRSFRCEQVYWPGLKADVSNYCRPCHTCQVVGKPNQSTKAGLQPVPAFDEPFSRIVIDCVGPLPKTKS